MHRSISGKKIHGDASVITANRDGKSKAMPAVTVLQRKGAPIMPVTDNIDELEKPSAPIQKQADQLNNIHSFNTGDTAVKNNGAEKTNLKPFQLKGGPNFHRQAPQLQPFAATPEKNATFGKENIITKSTSLPPAQLNNGAKVMQAQWVDSTEEGELFYNDLAYTDGIRWYYREHRRYGPQMRFEIDGRNPHAELLRDFQNMWDTREHFETLWARLNWDRNPVTVNVAMLEVKTVDDSFSTLTTGGFAGCIGIVLFQGNRRTLAHIYSGHIDDAGAWSGIGELRSKAGSADRAVIINAPGYWEKGDESGGDKFIRDFGLQGDITFLPGEMQSVTVSPGGAIT